MKNVLSNYPALRAGIYAVVAGALGVAAVFGFVTQDQVDSVLANVGLALGAATSVIALFNLSGQKAVGATPPPAVVVDLDAVAARVEQRLNIGVQQAQVYAADTVADLRRRAEQELGHRLGG